MHKLAELVSVSLAKELQNILNYWSANTIDEINGGFVGERDHYNNLVPNASKGIILNSRILWSFSAASNHLKTTKYTSICKRAFNYLKAHFNDENSGGVYWELDAKGKPINTRKQVYAQAFMIYALSEYYLFSKSKEALNWAVELYNLIEKYAKDTDFGGYIEAFNKDWSPIADMRLSDKDKNEAKTMNTHLHVLEAYTNLYKVYENEDLKQNLTDLINLFLTKFLNANNNLNLFFDEQWNLKSSVVSFGHDIETAWLLIEAAKVIKDKKIISETERVAVLIADVFIAKGVDVDGGVMNEYEPETGTLDGDKHWWPQAEALVGLRYAYNITKNERYLEVASKILNFIQTKIIDKTNGEWFWRVNKNGELYTSEYKIGMWKAPYHTSRACIVLNEKM
ncbi:AGE family epimerase/isomerase [Lutibacter sp. A64]|uniref:AGE family epimerase/isomerase n=1 Tax=Lutibacter sp. A64 TaxID=2918526 RepID=UPI001F056C23|nr:AGE family epimerase/isomerase [Lutibacter sp. A64]UMB53341.1 AGE family epimerase/isomerase [Lutibacter sp. A64]